MDAASEETKASQKHEYLCCNSDCSSKSSNFTIAPRSTVKYYQATNHGKRTQYVCEVCLKEYITHTEKMVTWALEKKPLFLFKMPEQKETVLITDSDEEESEENDDEIVEDVPLEIEDDLKEVIKDIIEKMDLKKQYEGGEKILLDDMSDLKDTMCSELITMRELQSSIDSVRNELFNAFAPVIEEIDTLEIIDSNFMDDNSMESGRLGQRRSSFGSPMRSPSKIAPLTGQEIFENTIQMMAEKSLISDVELIHMNEEVKDEAYKEVIGEYSSDEYEPPEKNPSEIEHYSLDFKIKCINIAKQHPTWSLKTLQRRGCHRLKRKEYLTRWEEEIKMGGSTFDKYSTIDSWTYNRFVEARQNYQQVTTRNLQQWALAAAAQFSNFEFKASISWVAKFKQKHGIRQRKVRNFVSRKETVTIEETLAAAESFWIQAQDLIPNFDEDFVINTDQTGVAMKKVTQVQRNTLDALASSEMQNYHSDIVALETRPQANPGFLPPPGPLQRPHPKVGEIVHVMKTNYFGVWSKAKIQDVIERTTECYFRIKYESSYRKGQIMKVVTGRQMAYSAPCLTRIPVGTRVIAIFRDDENSGKTKAGGNTKESYYCGVVAECPKCNNNYRYLIFFDDGYAQYVRHEKILVVCESSDNVWEDIHPDSRDFIRKYLIAYPERPMVRLSKGHVLRTEWNGKWWVARVLEVDASLVHLHFDADGRTEWIYRGSTRLGPLYTEIANANARSQSVGNFHRARCAGSASLKKLNLPYVEYTRGNEVEPEQLSASGRDDQSSKELLGEIASKDGAIRPVTQPVVRAVARKSTSIQKKYEERRAEYGVPCFEDKMIKYNKNLNIKIKTFIQHQCGPKCLEGHPYPQECTKGQNPLAKPLLCGWIRQIVRHRGGTKRVVLYMAPCGRRIRNLVELHSYLRMTKSTMPIDLFDFDFWVHCMAEFTVLKHLSYIKDISYGKEKVLIPAVNWVDHSYPRFVEYSTIRIPTPGVHLNLDPNFLVCCDCDDDCQDKERCACWQLTIQGTRCTTSGQVDPSVGYMYKRLPEPVTTGIYECNSRCKCNDTCLNRVAQLPLQQRLQVFRTRDRGWGVQCLNDIPQGAFVCIYVGQLLTEQGANEDGKAYGDEYLAELDYIEVVERIKEGYESDVMEDVSCEAETVNNSLGDDKPVLSNPSTFRETSEAKDSEDQDSENEDYEDVDGIYGRYQKGHKNSYDVDEDFKANLRLELTPSDLSIRSRLRKRKEKNEGTNKSDDSSTKRRKRKEGPRRDASESQSESSNMSDDEDSEEVKRQPLKFTAAEPNVTDIKKSGKSKLRSIREIYGPGEYCYIMDAKNIGNIGRYLNHSCTPNVFVQNVFVDSHDLRFPWVAFFALTYITAGTELTWDYNYDVGSVPGKVMYCYCGSSDCRGRLL